MPPKRNYQKEMEKVLERMEGTRPKLLLHACCAPCSSYVLSYLTQYFDIVLDFYNPNIAPQSEYEYRRAELRSPDPTANPYAAFSLLIYAGLYGIENSIKLPEPADFNLFNADEKTLAGFEKLPQDFASACKIAVSGDFIGEHMPSAILDTYFGR